MFLKISKATKLALTALLLFGNAYATIPNGYYDSCENKQGGSTLLKALFSVIGPHENVGYDGLWNVYKTSDIDENGQIWDMYSTKRWNTESGQCGNYKYVGDCYNREHSLPKSWFKEAAPMKSDAFHVYPTDGRVNGQRGNYPYGECSGGTTLPSNGNVHALGKLGTCTFPGYSGTVFEPDDEYKGDFARSYFYMAACYNDKIGNWSSDMLAGNNYPCYTQWAINLLLKWHRQDPVSQKELDRNDAIYAYQNNRNPFIDYPEMAEYIWGDKTEERWTSNGNSGTTPDPIDPDPVDPDPEPIDPDPVDPDPGIDPTPIPTPDPTIDGDGTLEKPYNCSQIIEGGIKASSAWFYGYVVGALNGTKVETSTGVTTNIAIADTPGETDPTHTCAVQIPNKSQFNSELNLKDNKDHVGRKILLQGQLTDYFGRPGMKNVTEYHWIDSTDAIKNATTTDPIEIHTSKGSIEVNASNEAVNITLAGVDGLIWFSGVINDSHQFSLPTGIYILRTPGNIHRILVK